ncbi:GPI transamidase component Gab1p [[Candida] anglica]|uniref:GPI transamidase component Gab1p n=1 Tax=[Candida] anglica TaxID=148631 RepID=A0ABP0ECI2_9ASCO
MRVVLSISKHYLILSTLNKYFLARNKRMASVFANNYLEVIGFLIRALIPTLVPSLPYNVSFVEVTTPLSSFKSLQEAFYYFRHNINLYDGGVNHHTPILVVLLNFLNELPYSYILFNFLYASIDLWIVKRLSQLNKWYSTRDSKQPNKNPTAAFPDYLFACFYLFNPLVIITNWSHSTLIFSNFFLVEAIYQVSIANSQTRAMIALAIASYLSYTPVFMVIPILTLGYSILKEQQQKSDTSTTPPFARIIQSLGIFIVSIGLLFLLSFTMTSSWQFIDSCFLSIITFKKISPNVGLWWYFFTEMFVFFNPFFVGVFNLFSVIFIIPLTIRFSGNSMISDPFLSVVLCYLWLIFTKSYPTVGDLGFLLAFIPIFRSSFLPYCKFGGITSLVLLGTLTLSPIFYYCWIVLGNGNSNFFYSLNLVWGGVHGMILIDLIWGKLTYDYMNENEVPKEVQKKLRLTQI